MSSGEFSIISGFNLRANQANDLRGHIIKYGLDGICKRWTGLHLKNMDWIGFVKNGLEL